MFSPIETNTGCLVKNDQIKSVETYVCVLIFLLWNPNLCFKTDTIKSLFKKRKKFTCLDPEGN